MWEEERRQPDEFYLESYLRNARGSASPFVAPAHSSFSSSRSPFPTIPPPLAPPWRSSARQPPPKPPLHSNARSRVSVWIDQGGIDVPADEDMARDFRGIDRQLFADGRSAQAGRFKPSHSFANQEEKEEEEEEDGDEEEYEEEDEKERYKRRTEEMVHLFESGRYGLMQSGPSDRGRERHGIDKGKIRLQNWTTPDWMEESDLDIQQASNRISAHHRPRRNYIVPPKKILSPLVLNSEEYPHYSSMNPPLLPPSSLFTLDETSPSKNDASSPSELFLLHSALRRTLHSVKPSTERSYSYLNSNSNLNPIYGGVEVGLPSSPPPPSNDVRRKKTYPIRSDNIGAKLEASNLKEETEVGLLFLSSSPPPLPNEVQRKKKMNPIRSEDRGGKPEAPYSKEEDTFELPMGNPVGSPQSDTLSGELCGELDIAMSPVLNKPNNGTESNTEITTTTNVVEESRMQLAVSEKSKELALSVVQPRSFSQKYRPKAFEELVGQSVVVRALSNAVLQNRIAPVYLFQGSRGTGKTSAARIFAAALNCLASPVDLRPCWDCEQCDALALGRSPDIRELDAASNNGIDRVKTLLDTIVSAPLRARFKVVIIDECHVLDSDAWNALLKSLEEPPPNVVFILVTTEPERIPQTAASRCQRYRFAKIKDSEILSKLQRLANLEKLEIEQDALGAIISNSDGSLRDAETTLDQLSLLAQDINSAVVHDLVGCSSNDNLLSLLDFALSGNTVGTVRRLRELVESDVEPLALTSQLATLITDILAGTSETVENFSGAFFNKFRSSGEEMTERLRSALRILAEAEKQLRYSSDQLTWLTAALLQFNPEGTLTSVTLNSARTSLSMGSDFLNHDTGPAPRHQSSEFISGGVLSEETPWSYPKSASKPLFEPNPRTLKELQTSATTSSSSISVFERVPFAPTKLDQIWSSVSKSCQFLPSKPNPPDQVKLLSISVSEGNATAYLEFTNPDHKTRAERYCRSIASAFEAVLGFPVEVMISLGSLPPTQHQELNPITSPERGVEQIDTLKSERVMLSQHEDMGGGLRTRDRKTLAKESSKNQRKMISKFFPAILRSRDGKSSSLARDEADISKLVSECSKEWDLNGNLASDSQPLSKPPRKVPNEMHGLRVCVEDMIESELQGSQQSCVSDEPCHKQAGHFDLDLSSSIDDATSTVDQEEEICDGEEQGRETTNLKKTGWWSVKGHMRSFTKGHRKSSASIDDIDMVITSQGIDARKATQLNQKKGRLTETAESFSKFLRKRNSLVKSQPLEPAES